MVPQKLEMRYYHHAKKLYEYLSSRYTHRPQVL